MISIKRKSLFGFVVLCTFSFVQVLPTNNNNDLDEWNVPTPPTPRKSFLQKILSYVKENKELSALITAFTIGGGVLVYKKLRERSPDRLTPPPPPPSGNGGEQSNGRQGLSSYGTGLKLRKPFRIKLQDKSNLVKNGLIKEQDLFEYYVGVKEGNFTRSMPLPDVLKQGVYHQYSVGELRTKTKNIIPFDGKPSFEVKENLDVSKFQAKKEYRDSVVQMAANFNARMATDSVSGYAGVHLQGQSAAIVALGGVIQILYRLPAINLLEKFSDSTSDRSLLNLTLDDENITKKVAVGFFEGLRVISQRVKGSNLDRLVTDKNQIINQLFTAAYSGPSSIREITLAKLLLDASYEGTIRSALLHGKRHVVLTLMGGGVFANKWDWIADAIEKQRDLIKNNNMQIEVVFWPQSDRCRNNNFRKRMNKIKKYIEQ